MKRILSIVFLLCLNFAARSQWPINQNIGSDSTMVRVGPTKSGGLWGGLVVRAFSDTTAANLTRIRQYEGGLLFTTGDSTFWYRGPGATRWFKFGSNTVTSSGWNIGGNLFPVLPSPYPTIGTLAPWGGGFGIMTNSVVRAAVPDGGFTLSNDTSATKVFTWNPTTKDWGYANWNNGGGGTYTAGDGLLLTGSSFKVLTKRSITIDNDSVMLVNDTTATAPYHLYGFNIAGRRGVYRPDTNYISGFSTMVRPLISLTTTGSSGAATYSNVTGVLNIPQYPGGVDSAAVRSIVSDSVGTGSLYFTYATVINHGKFWEQDTSYTLCNWEGWVKVTRPSALGYFILDGAGGQHTVLLGAMSGTTTAVITGNFYDGSSIISMTSSDAFPLNEWMHIAFVYDGTNAKLLLNGVITHMTAFTGVRKYTAGGSDGNLYIGDNDHAPFPGQVKQVRGIEGSVGGVTGQNMDIKKHFTQYTYDGYKASFLSDYSIKGTRLFVDRGTGFEGRSHDGIFSNGGELYDTYGYPQWIKGDVIKPTSAPTPAPVPGSAKIFDSFSRRNKLFLFQEHGGLDSTEGGSEGKKAWATGYYLGGSTAAGILSGRAVIYTGQITYAYVPTASQNADIRVDRGGDEFCTGIVARFENTSNYYRVYASDTNITFVNVESGVTTYPAAFTVTGGWTTLRVTVSGTTMEVFTDGVSAGTKTIISNASGIYHGITDCGQANWYDNFTIY